MRSRLSRSTNARDTVDLHGLTANEAVTLSREAANMWWESADGGKSFSRLLSMVSLTTGTVHTENTPARSLTIVTGKGNHSKGGVGVIGPVVYNTLEAEGWRVTKRPGAVVVSGWNRRGGRSA